MTAPRERRTPPRVLVIADVESTARSPIDHILKPGGSHAWGTASPAPPAAIPGAGDDAPAVVLAAHFPTARLRDLFHLNVADVLLKPYRPVDLGQAIFELAESRSAETNTQMLARSLETTREQARRRTEEIRLLSEIGRAVAALADLEAILARVVEGAGVGGAPAPGRGGGGVRPRRGRGEHLPGRPETQRTGSAGEPSSRSARGDAS